MTVSNALNTATHAVAGALAPGSVTPLRDAQHVATRSHHILVRNALAVDETRTLWVPQTHVQITRIRFFGGQIALDGTDYVTIAIRTSAIPVGSSALIASVSNELANIEDGDALDISGATPGDVVELSPDPGIFDAPRTSHQQLLVGYTHSGAGQATDITYVVEYRLVG